MADKQFYYYKTKDGREFGTRYTPVPEGDPDRVNITKEEYQELCGFDPNEPIFIPTPEFHHKVNQMEMLKRQLSDTDYKAIKFAEGELAEEEYAPVKEQRRAWRAQINQLEQEIDAIINNNQ